jgi:hypothetical protein
MIATMIATTIVTLVFGVAEKDIMLNLVMLQHILKVII